MNKFIKPLLLLLFPLISCVAAFSQVTTGTLTGTATSEKGEVLNGATITAVHEPTGSKYQTIAGKGGQYTLPNLRVGGPYKITIHFTGYADAVVNDVTVTLGTPVVINSVLSTSAETMTGVVVVGTG